MWIVKSKYFGAFPFKNSFFNSFAMFFCFFLLCFNTQDVQPVLGRHWSGNNLISQDIFTAKGAQLVQSISKRDTYSLFKTQFGLKPYILSTTRPTGNLFVDSIWVLTLEWARLFTVEEVRHIASSSIVNHSSLPFFASGGLGFPVGGLLLVCWMMDCSCMCIV